MIKIKHTRNAVVVTVVVPRARAGSIGWHGILGC